MKKLLTDREMCGKIISVTEDEIVSRNGLFYFGSKTTIARSYRGRT